MVILYYFINNKVLYNAIDGKKKIEIDKEEAVKIASKYIREDLKVSYVEKINETGPHHEYRERLLPAYVISYDTKDNLKHMYQLLTADFKQLDTETGDGLTFYG